MFVEQWGNSLVGQTRDTSIYFRKFLLLTAKIVSSFDWRLSLSLKFNGKFSFEMNSPLDKITAMIRHLTSFLVFAGAQYPDVGNNLLSEGFRLS